VDLEVQSNGDLLEFTPTELSCPADVHVRLTFRNTGRYVSFQHNWVLIRAGTFDAVTAAATLAGEEHGWVPAGNPAIVAATSLCGRGQSVSIEFDAPSPGRYLYICSTPGHSASMWGVLTVTPA
jgi:azurin